MFIAFGTAALMLLTLSVYGAHADCLRAGDRVYFGVFGEIYSLFPATSGDTFGVKFATTNNGMLYTAKGDRIAAGAAGEHCCGQIRLAGGFRDRRRAQRHRGAAGRCS